MNLKDLREEIAIEIELISSILNEISSFASGRNSTITSMS